MKTFLLEIYTPYGKYFDRYVDELVIQTEEYVLGILPNHTPLVAKVKTSKMEIFFLFIFTKWFFISIY